GALDLPLDHRSPRRTAVGERERGAGRRLPVHPACRGAVAAPPLSVHEDRARSPSTDILEKSVLAFIPSIAAAPAGPQNRPPLRSRAAAIASRWCFSIAARDNDGSGLEVDRGGAAAAT